MTLSSKKNPAASLRYKRAIAKIWGVPFLQLSSIFFGCLAGAFLTAWIVFDMLAPNDRPQVMHIPYSYPEPETTWPFELAAEGIYRIRFINQPEESSDFTLGFVTDLVNEQGIVVNAIEGEFSKTSGYDDEGAWVEYVSTDELTLKLDTPGWYQLVTRFENTAHPPGRLEVQIERIAYTKYIRIALLITLILFVACLQIRAWLISQHTTYKGRMQGNTSTMIWLVLVITIIILLNV